MLYFNAYCALGSGEKATLSKCYFEVLFPILYVINKHREIQFKQRALHIKNEASTYTMEMSFK